MIDKPFDDLECMKTKVYTVETCHPFLMTFLYLPYQILLLCSDANLFGEYLALLT